jgi:hypothetical protein
MDMIVAVDRQDMVVDRRRADAELVGDLFLRAAGEQVVQHFSLPTGQAGATVLAGRR